LEGVSFHKLKILFGLEDLESSWLEKLAFSGNVKIMAHSSYEASDLDATGANVTEGKAHILFKRSRIQFLSNPSEFILKLTLKDVEIFKDSESLANASEGEVFLSKKRDHSQFSRRDIEFHLIEGNPIQFEQLKIDWVNRSIRARSWINQEGLWMTSNRGFSCQKANDLYLDQHDGVWMANFKCVIGRKTYPGTFTSDMNLSSLDILQAKLNLRNLVLSQGDILVQIPFWPILFVTR
jgi:hypothetical protein